MNKHSPGTSLFELLVAIAIIAASMAIMAPALRKGRLNARAVQTMNNQRQIVVGVSCFALDNNGRYPESVATIGISQKHWNWQEPTVLTARRQRGPQLKRSVGAYLRSYIEDARTMFCPNAPGRYKYFRQAWDAGDNWDNPDTLSKRDPVIGTYCFYWNYIGFLDTQKTTFRGPQTLAGDQGYSKLLVSDYFGYGHWRNRSVYGDYRAFGSCERFRAARIVQGTAVSSDFWSSPADNPDTSLQTLRLRLHAGYADGHVDRYRPPDVVPMKVSITSDGGTAYPDGLGAGTFYLPTDALY